MKSIADTIKWLLEADIRAKNAASAFVALVFSVGIYVASKKYQWFQHIERYGVAAEAVALTVTFFMFFLGVWLLWSVVAVIHQRFTQLQRQEEEADQRRSKIRNDLFCLTGWQRRFLLRFITENRNQIPEFEVGEYRAAWDFEMTVLVEKRIVKYHRRAGVYEIDPEYLEYLQKQWDAESGNLN